MSMRRVQHSRNRSIFLKTKGEDGQATAIVLALIIVLILMVGAVQLFAVSQVPISANAVYSEQALSAAQAGISHYINELNSQGQNYALEYCSTDGRLWTKGGTCTGTDSSDPGFVDNFTSTHWDQVPLTGQGSDQESFQFMVNNSQVSNTPSTVQIWVRGRAGNATASAGNLGVSYSLLKATIEPPTSTVTGLPPSPISCTTTSTTEPCAAGGDQGQPLPSASFLNSAHNAPQITNGEMKPTPYDSIYVPPSATAITVYLVGGQGGSGAPSTPSSTCFANPGGTGGSAGVTAFTIPVAARSTAVDSTQPPALQDAAEVETGDWLFIAVGQPGQNASGSNGGAGGGELGVAQQTSGTMPASYTNGSYVGGAGASGGNGSNGAGGGGGAGGASAIWDLNPEGPPGGSASAATWQLLGVAAGGGGGGGGGCGWHQGIPSVEYTTDGGSGGGNGGTGAGPGSYGQPGNGTGGGGEWTGNNGVSVLGSEKCPGSGNSLAYDATSSQNNTICHHSNGQGDLTSPVDSTNQPPGLLGSGGNIRNGVAGGGGGGGGAGGEGLDNGSIGNNNDSNGQGGSNCNGSNNQTGDVNCDGGGGGSGGGGNMGYVAAGLIPPFSPTDTTAFAGGAALTLPGYVPSPPLIKGASLTVNDSIYAADTSSSPNPGWLGLAFSGYGQVSNLQPEGVEFPQNNIESSSQLVNTSSGGALSTLEALVVGASGGSSGGSGTTVQECGAYGGSGSQLIVNLSGKLSVGDNLQFSPGYEGIPSAASPVNAQTGNGGNGDSGPQGFRGSGWGANNGGLTSANGGNGGGSAGSNNGSTSSNGTKMNYMPGNSPGGGGGGATAIAYNSAVNITAAGGGGAGGGDVGGSTGSASTTTACSNTTSPAQIGTNSGASQRGSYGGAGGIGSLFGMGWTLGAYGGPGGGYTSPGSPVSGVNSGNCNANNGQDGGGGNNNLGAGGGGGGGGCSTASGNSGGGHAGHGSGVSSSPSCPYSPNGGPCGGGAAGGNAGDSFSSPTPVTVGPSSLLCNGQSTAPPCLSNGYIIFFGFPAVTNVNTPPPPTTVSTSTTTLAVQQLPPSTSPS